MARARTATERVALLSRSQIDSALAAAGASETDTTFYKIVNMRNPSRSYFIRANHRLHSLKAVVTYALQQDQPETTARDFHAAHAATRMTGLGFDVVHENKDREDAREREWLPRLSRKGQRGFREKLVDLYRGCALSGCSTLAVLEAAHIDPVASNGLDKIQNGILLRADLHKLFDTGLLAINPNDGSVKIAESIVADYGELCRTTYFSPPKEGPLLSKFAKRWQAFHGVDEAA